MDITNIAKKWYNCGSNYGIAIKDYMDTSADQCAAFYSYFYPASSSPRAVFSITYINNKGLEDYWSYSSFDVGTAGTAYINDYTGNLVFVHNGASIAGNNNFTLQHIFNNYMADTVNSNILPLSGKGWRLNVEQRVVSSAGHGLSEEYSAIYPYVYEDGDGTEHYFMKVEVNEEIYYYDEDGLGLELIVDNLSSSARYKISDYSDNIMEFDSNGNLRKISDSNDNIIDINRTVYGKITSVTTHNTVNGSSRNITLNSSNNNYVSTAVDPSGRTTYYYYTNQRLVRIVNPDGTNIIFNYDSDGSMTSVTDIDGYKIEFTYTNSASGKKVTSVQEYGTNESIGQKVTFSRNLYNTTTIQTSGIDGIYGNSDDIISTYQFDNYGRTLSVNYETSEKKLGAQSYSYTDGEPDQNASNIKNLNRISKQYCGSMETYNYLKNGNMEKSANWTNQAYGGSNTFTVSRTSAESYFGKYSYKIQSTAYSSGSRARVYQDVTSGSMVSGHTYTLSAYLKVSNIQSSENKYGAAISAASLDSSNNVINTKYSEMINETTDVNLENGWRKVSVTFTVPSNSVKTRVDLFLFQATGTVYFDGIQLEEGSTHNRFNLIENAGFEVHTTGTVPARWSAVNTNSATDTCTTSDKQDGAFSFKFSADQSVEKLLEQEIDINSNDNGTYIFSGWVKNSRIKSGIINNEFIDSSTMMIAQVEYTDSSVEKKEFLMFNNSLSDWQYCSGTFSTISYEDASKVPCKIKIILRSANQANDCYFDDIQLIKSSTKSYDYNNGDLISVSESPESQETMEYNDHDLTGITDSKGYDSEYTYDNKHNLTSSVNQRGITYNYSYDLYGNVTSLSIHDNSDTDNYEIKTDTSYTNDKLFVSQVTDEDGNTVNYNYNANTGTLTSETDSKGTTSYTYNSNNDLPQTVSKGNVTVNYGYTNDTNRNLTSVSNGNVSYSINYDEYNNVQSTSVGSNLLAFYNYGNNNNSLQTLTYGNGDYIGYFYNEYGNVREVKQNGVSAFKWETDNSGNLTKFVDLLSSREYNYIYDTAGRLTSQNIKSTAGNLVLPFARVNYGYDLNNNVSKLINTAGKRTVKVDYNYQQDNLPSTVKIDNDKTKYFNYDSLGRLSSTRAC